MAALEVKGSRREWEDLRFKYGETLHVGDALSDAVAEGTFFTPKAGTIESGLGGRKSVHVSKDPDTIPGIWFFRVLYRAYKAMT